MNEKSVGIAYILLIFVGFLGVHCFYLGKNVRGVIYLLTLGLFGFGLLYDLFTLGNQVRKHNDSKHQRSGSVVNVTNVIGGDN